MSVNLSIKSVPDEWAQALRQRAERNHRSLQGELMAMVERAVSESPVAVTLAAATMPQASPPVGTRRGTLGIEELSRRAAARYAGLPAQPADMPNSTDIIREMRDTRWG